MPAFEDEFNISNTPITQSDALNQPMRSPDVCTRQVREHGTLNGPTRESEMSHLPMTEHVPVDHPISECSTPAAHTAQSVSLYSAPSAAAEMSSMQHDHDVSSSVTLVSGNMTYM